MMRILCRSRLEAAAAAAAAAQQQAGRSSWRQQRCFLLLVLAASLFVLPGYSSSASHNDHPPRHHHSPDVGGIDGGGSLRTASEREDELVNTGGIIIGRGLETGSEPAPILLGRGIAEGIPSTPRSEHDIHVVFSTGCSPFQDFQSITLFFSAEAVDQPGPVTRVASGCTEEQQRELLELMDMQPERFRVHFTPDYSLDPDTGERFVYYNKPNGLAHFLENADPPVAEAVIVLIDPDMVLVSPLTPYVGNSDLMLWDDEMFASGPDWVVEGQPVAQYYALGNSWASWSDLPEITEDLGPDTPARNVSMDQASRAYPVGPPYFMHPRDWVRLVNVWASVSPKVYKGHRNILAEMYGFCIAAAHLGLPHRVAYGLMVSDSSGPEREGWPLVDPLESQACDASAVSDRHGSLPPIVHYCQTYRVGTYMFNKRQPSLETFFSCAADSLELPPADYLSSPMGTLRVHSRHAGNRKQHVPLMQGVREGYAMCVVLRALNAAQVSYKSRYCRPEEVSEGVRRFTDLSPDQVSRDLFKRGRAGM